MFSPFEIVCGIDLCSLATNFLLGNNLRLPRTHRRFSGLNFNAGTSSSADVVDEQDVGYPVLDEDEPARTSGSQDSSFELQKHHRGWLENDDIEEF